MVQCSKCGRILMDSTQDGGYKIRTRMLLFKEGKAIALCPTCKEHNEVPITLGSVAEPLPKTKLVIKDKEGIDNK